MSIDDLISYINQPQAESKKNKKKSKKRKGQVDEPEDDTTKTHKAMNA